MKKLKKFFLSSLVCLTLFSYVVPIADSNFSSYTTGRPGNIDDSNT